MKGARKSSLGIGCFYLYAIFETSRYWEELYSEDKAIKALGEEVY